MSICPKCNTEYESEIDFCPNCNCSLINFHTEGLKYDSVVYLEKEQGKKFVDLLHYSGLSEAYLQFISDNDNYAILVDQKNYRKAMDILSVFEENEDDESDSHDVNNLDPASDTSKVFERTGEKYKDNLSSAYTFFICGVLGLIVVACNAFGIISIFSSSLSYKIIFSSVMGLLFIIFIIIGVRAFLYARKIKGKAAEEDQLIQDISSWLKDNVTKDDVNVFRQDCDSDADLYFEATTYIQNQIGKHFPETQTALIESMADEFYNTLLDK